MFKVLLGGVVLCASISSAALTPVATLEDSITIPITNSPGALQLQQADGTVAIFIIDQYLTNLYDIMNLELFDDKLPSDVLVGWIPTLPNDGAGSINRTILRLADGTPKEVYTIQLSMTSIPTEAVEDLAPGAVLNGMIYLKYFAVLTPQEQAKFESVRTFWHEERRRAEERIQEFNKQNPPSEHL